MPGNPIGVGVREAEAFIGPAAEYPRPDGKKKGLSHHGPASPAIVPGQDRYNCP